MTISLHLIWASLFLTEKVCSLNPPTETVSWLQNQVSKKCARCGRNYLQLETSILLIFWVSLPGGKPGKVDLVVVSPSGPGWVGGILLALSLIFMTWRDTLFEISLLWADINYLGHYFQWKAESELAKWNQSGERQELSQGQWEQGKPVDRKEIWSTPEIGSNGGTHARLDYDCMMVKLQVE